MLEDKLYKLNSFRRQYEALLTLSVCDTIPNLILYAIVYQKYNGNKIETIYFHQ